MNWTKSGSTHTYIHIYMYTLRTHTQWKNKSFKLVIAILVNWHNWLKINISNKNKGISVLKAKEYLYWKLRNIWTENKGIFVLKTKEYLYWKQGIFVLKTKEYLYWKERNICTENKEYLYWKQGIFVLKTKEYLYWKQRNICTENKLWSNSQSSLCLVNSMKNPHQYSQNNWSVSEVSGMPELKRGQGSQRRKRRFKPTDRIWLLVWEKERLREANRTIFYKNVLDSCAWS